MTKLGDKLIAAARGVADPLVDRDCVLLDGRCDCERPIENCKKYARQDDKEDQNV